MKKESSYDFLKQRNIVVLISCRILWGITQTLFMPYFSLFALSQEGVTPVLLGYIFSIQAIGIGMLAPISGQLADSLGRKKMIFAGTTLHALSYFFYIIANDFKMIFIGSLVEGLSKIHVPALQAITQDSLNKNERGLGFSATTGLQSLPTLISPLIGGILTEQLGIDRGMRIGFSLALGVGLIVAFIRLKFLNETITRTAEKMEPKKLISLMKESYGSIFRLLKEYDELKGLLILSIVNTFFCAITAPFWVVYARDIVNITTFEWGLILNIVAGVNVLVLFFSGKFVDRFGRKKIMLINLLVAPIITLSFIYSQNFYQMLLVQIFIRAQNAFIMPAAAALLADIVPRESRGRALAALSPHPVVISISVITIGFFKLLPSFGGSALSGYFFKLEASFPWFLLAGAHILEFLICYFLIKEPEKLAE